MKLSRLYANKMLQFEPIDFQSGLNVILAEIRLPENKAKDTHNLGKTTLGRLIDFMLLAGKDQKFFLFKHENVFKDFIFFLEIELQDETYVTLRRSVEQATKISFKKHQHRGQDFSAIADGEWDHLDVAFDKAKELLDSILDLRALKPWSYRKGLGYLVRSQEDFRDVFQLGKFMSRHADWKPFLAHILGFNANNVELLYEKEEALDKKQLQMQTIKAEMGGTNDDIAKINGLLLLKSKDAAKKQELLDSFDFRAPDKHKSKQVVEDLDVKIAALNSERYALNHNRKRIVSSLEDDQILFKPDEAAALFKEVGVLFSGQVKKDFEQLIAFNKAITEERRAFLQEEREEIEAELKRVNNELAELGRRRSDTLSFLSSTDVFSKYKSVSNELIQLKADIETLERQKGFLQRLQELRTEVRTLTEEKNHLQTQIEEDVAAQDNEASLFSKIRVYFSDIIEAVISRKALLSVTPNQQGHLDFKAEILDEAGKATSADLGHTYRKLLCIAFDMAVLRGHLGQAFPRFMFHDGVFEVLDPRKKENLLDVIRDYTELGLQHIITTLDSELPPARVEKAEADGAPQLIPFIKEEEVVLTLHDEGEHGRLFKIPSW
jgi:uncharacterized protein YydD (DUF2326 family)